MLRPARGELRPNRRVRAFPETISAHAKTPPINVELRVMRHALDRHDLLVAVGQEGEKIDHVGIGRDAVGRYENLYRRAATGMLK